MTKVRLFGVAIILLLSMAACATPSGSKPTTSGPDADLARVLEHTAQLKDHAATMTRLAKDASAVAAGAAKQEYEAMVVIAAEDQPWLASARLPDNVRAAYERMLKNVQLNASRLFDGSNDRYFLFLGSSLAPVWSKDLDAIQGLAGQPR